MINIFSKDFAIGETISKPYFKEGGIVVGLEKSNKIEKLYTITDDVHALCVGSTRSGKSRTVVLQSICTLGLAGENMVLSDPKGELYQYTYPLLERLGYEVIAVDFRNPLKSNQYNFLQQVINAVDNNDIPGAIEATWDITSSLVGEAKGERIWTDGEASTIAAAIMSVVFDNRDEYNRQYQNMTNVYFFISQMCKTVGKSMPIVEYMKALDDNHPAKGLIAISEIAPSKTRGSFFTAALTTLRLFTNPLINAMTSKSDFNLSDLGSKKTAVFIILPDEKTTYYSLASLLTSQIYEQLVKSADARGGRLQRRVNFLLDEFGNFTKIPDFANKLTVGGGRGIRFNLFLQSFAQLEEKYGKEVARTIRGNCQTWIYLQAEDQETLEEISKKLGNYTVSTYSLSANSNPTSTSSSQSVNLTGRSLLTPDEVRMISRPYSLIISRDNPAIMYCPDISEMGFNKMLGLGDKEHNRILRERREARRKVRKLDINGDMNLWGIWEYYQED
ncbi:VirD4-like conjugal transfer protein, CD1115 family [Tissierella carlieri]|uniref:VirD4-like conjugal transfer protein, CD1115 family n=1 Tax=Tissierella carlieri TaxID=689904 RepID=UPI00386FE8BF